MKSIQYLRLDTVSDCLTTDSIFNQTPDADLFYHPRRLRWIGDVMLSHYVSLRLFSRYPTMLSDGLTITRSNVISSAALSSFYDIVGFEFLNFNLRSEKAKEKMVEAFIGAVLLKLGNQAALTVSKEVFESAGYADTSDAEVNLLSDILSN